MCHLRCINYGDFNGRRRRGILTFDREREGEKEGEEKGDGFINMKRNGVLMKQLAKLFG